MTWVTNLLWFLSGLALLFSIGALLVLALLWERSRNSSAERLSSRLSEAESLIEQLSADFKNLRAARNMAASRALKRSSESLDQEAPAPAGDSADRTRADLNRRLATGELKPRGIP